MVTLVWIHSDGETPNLGSGLRLVQARDLRNGRVQLTSPHGLEGRQSVTKATYNRIAKWELQ
jgi:hypothetical protein